MFPWEKAFDLAWFSSKTYVSEPLFFLGSSAITMGMIFQFFLTSIAAYLLARFAQRQIRKFGDRHKRFGASGIYTLSRLAFYGIFALGLFVAIGMLGVDLTSVALVAGALSVGIGFGLQAIFNNFISGIIILLERSIRVGDMIELESGVIGRVKSISVRTTLLISYDNTEILVPNSELVTKRFNNWTLTNRKRKLKIPFRVPFGTDKDHLKEIIVDAALKLPSTLSDPKPTISLYNLGEYGLEFYLIVWIEEDSTAAPPISYRGKYLSAIESALTENNITIPYPIREMRSRASTFVQEETLS